jgi:hypothetical protein
VFQQDVLPRLPGRGGNAIEGKRNRFDAAAVAPEPDDLIV